MDLDRSASPNYVHSGCQEQGLSIAVKSRDQIHEYPNAGYAGNKEDDIALIIIRDAQEIQKLAGYNDADIATIPNSPFSAGGTTLTSIGFKKDGTGSLESADLAVYDAEVCARLLNAEYNETEDATNGMDAYFCATGSASEVDVCHDCYPRGSHFVCIHTFHALFFNLDCHALCLTQISGNTAVQISQRTGQCTRDCGDSGQRPLRSGFSLECS